MTILALEITNKTNFFHFSTPQESHLSAYSLCKDNLLIRMIQQSKIVSHWTAEFCEEHFYFDVFYLSAFTKVTRINSTDYEVKLVDTAGQDEYSIFPAQYSMDFHGYVLVYSITSQKSFEVIQIIYEKLLDVMGKAQYVWL